MYKRLLLALALFGAAPLVHAQEKAPKPSLKALDEKNGFRDAHFGDDVSKFQNLSKIEADGNSVFYKKTDENLKIGDADLKEVSYGFYKDKLSFILIRTTGLVDSDKVLAALEAQYGKGFKSNPYMKKYYWGGSKVSMLFQENSLSHDADITLSSKEIAKQQAEDEKQSAKKAASDL